MYIRLVRGQAQPGQVEELARRWQAFWGEQMPQISGFRHASRRRLPKRLSLWWTGCPRASAEEAGMGAVPV